MIACNVAEESMTKGLIALASLVVIALPVRAQIIQPLSGGADAGGGNAQVAEFYKMTKHFQSRMLANGKGIDAQFPVDALSERLKTLIVVAVVGPLEHQGAKVDAINYPVENKIELDDQTWAQRDLPKRYQIAIHELLGLLGQADDFYDHSRSLADATIIGLDPNKPKKVCTISLENQLYTGYVVVLYAGNKYVSGYDVHKNITQINYGALKSALKTLRAKAKQLYDDGVCSSVVDNLKGY